MADFSALKTSIQNYIKQNGNEEITGNLLQQVLLSMVTTLGDSAINDLVTALNAEIANRGNADTTLQGNINSEATARENADTQLGNRITSEAEARDGADNILRGLIDGIKANIDNGYVYAGIANPSTTPASGKVFYLALTAGTYTNFGATVVPQGINILKYNGSAWSLDSFLGLDNAPTQGSNNLVKSGGVLDSIIKDGSAFDLSAYNSGTTYADLSAALTALNALPAAYKKGGMSIKFVHTSDNKYVRCNLLTDSFTTDTTQWAIGDDGVYVENQEYIYIKTDYQDRILWAIKADGSIYYGAGVPQQVIDYIEEKVEELNGDITAIQDFLAGITEETLLGYLNKTYGEYSESPEWINVETDSGGKILNGIKKDGSHYAYNLHSETIDKNANDIANLNNTKVEKVEGKGLSSNDYTDSDKKIVKCDSIIEDIEDRIVIETDSDDKILSYRDKDGILHENVGIDSDSVNTNHLNLSEEGMEEFQQALIGAGFNPKMPIDWSDSKELHLPIPRTCAKINLIVTSLPTTKTDDCEGYVEYIDFDGNYFKKKMVLNAQGESSMHFLEKNFTLDIDDKSKIQFGNWVFQDSFHLKAYYIDVFRGVNNICYKYTNKVIEYLNCRANRVLNNPVNVTNTDGTGTFNIDFGSSAMCQPDGFPVEIYHNGEYYGLYAINLKKHRDNYQMSKNNYQQALLDGLLSWDTIWDGTIDWTQFELRNPKTLILEDGITEYDGDNPSEIIGINSPNYDSTNINHVNTATTKAMIQEVASCLADVYNMPITTPQEIADAKAAFEAHYDVKMLKCYFILSNVLYHRDGFAKNWIWAIYDGMASPTFYDMDTVFGRHWTGGMMYNSSTTEIFGLESTDTVSPSTVLASLYKDELDLMYKELRDKGLISVSHIMKYIQDWIDCQTREAIKRNLKKWTAIPSYRADGGSYPPPLSYDVAHQSDGMYDCPARVEKWLTARLVTLDIYFNYNQN